MKKISLEDDCSIKLHLICTKRSRILYKILKQGLWSLFYFSVLIKGDFPLAEWNEISGKCFLTHRWGLGMGLGHVMCKGRQLFFCWRPLLDFPTHPPTLCFAWPIFDFVSILSKFMFWTSMYTCIFCEVVIVIVWIKVRLAVVGLTWLPGVCEN